MDFSRQWRQRHRQSFDTLLAWLKGCVGICFWYVCRPTVVAVLLERPHTLAGSEQLKRVRRLSSTDPDPERAPPQVTRVQNRLVRLSSVCLVALHALSPPLPELLTQDGRDLSGWQRLVSAGFGSPTLDKPGPPPLTYGTLLAAVNVCVRPFTRAEPARRSSGTGSHEPLLELRAALLTGLHQTLTLVLEQAVLHRLLPPADADDQPLSWDQLREELKPFLDSVRRQQQGRSSPHPQEGGPPADQALLPLLDRLVNAVLK
ncbi:uncharacterized protein LOC119113279 [Pollicipes pollicipes]|uniref:uncharacterized protein LOC119113279 n=1 Tax=Pollicipes pollicipes TaxID=41117 RepID=UPI0018857A48|nr:uncharacterized protein LOC119113279 [Pollicipes pollicipes]